MIGKSLGFLAGEDAPDVEAFLMVSRAQRRAVAHKPAGDDELAFKITAGSA